MRHDPGTIRGNSQFENMVIFRIPQMRSPKKVDFAVLPVQAKIIENYIDIR